jgi:hypothetical protein
MESPQGPGVPKQVSLLPVWGEGGGGGGPPKFRLLVLPSPTISQRLKLGVTYLLDQKIQKTDTHVSVILSTSMWPNTVLAAVTMKT